MKILKVDLSTGNAVSWLKIGGLAYLWMGLYVSIYGRYKNIYYYLAVYWLYILIII